VEIVAVVLNLLYTFFYLNSNPLCYLFGVLCPLVWMVLCFRKQLYAEPVLQFFYVAMSVYGYYNTGAVWQMTRWSYEMHVPYILVGILISIAAGFFLAKNTKAKLPYPDSVVTVFAIIGTWLMANYVHESWLYLMAINALSIVIYVRRKLFIGAAMFLLYLFMSVDGYFEFNWFVI
jgi:nicotinamide mononucleotide transporter